MADDSDPDPALGHPDDAPAADAEPAAGDASDDGITPREERAEVVGVPLMDGEEPIWSGHPSWWTYFPQLITTGFLLGILGVLWLWVNTNLVVFGIEATVTEFVGLLTDAVVHLMSLADKPISRDVIRIHWWMWLGAFVLIFIPLLKEVIKCHLISYVITTHRVMTVKIFPGKTKNWCEIEEIKSFTSSAGTLEQRLNVGNVEFQPANSDKVVFENVDDYEYWESRVKELQREYWDDEDDPEFAPEDIDE